MILLPDLRTWVELAILVITCLIASAFLAPHVSASESFAGDLNGSYVIEQISDAIDTLLGNEPEPKEPIPYIHQGDVVYVGDVIDVSGVVPPYEYLAYWDGFDMYDEEPDYKIELAFEKKGYWEFYLDPDVFERRTGWWYKYDDKFEPQGNNKAFKVLPRVMKNSTMTFPNGTVINQSELLPTNYTVHSIQPEPLLPERHVADYVVARGDGANITGEGQVWIFGRKDGIYDHAGLFSAQELDALESGTYQVAIIEPGSNTIYEARWDDTNKTINPGLYGKEPIDAAGMSAPVVYAKLNEMLAGTDDILTEYKMELDFPYITINRADELYINDRTVLDIRGYTNAANNTEITVVLDEKTTYYKDVAKQTVKTNAVRTSPGNLSYYRALLPIDYDNLAADARNHTLEARTALGGKVQADFKISVMPADSFKPNASLKYIENRNPFVPTPTPEKVEVIVERTVEVPKPYPVTPSNEQVKAQQDEVISEKIDGYIGLGLTVFAIAVVALVFIGGVLYFRSVRRRVKGKQ